MLGTLFCALLCPHPLQETAPPPLRALIVSGQNNHDWQWTTPSLQRILESEGRFEVEVTTTPARTLADAEALATYDVLVLDYNGAPWGDAAQEGFLQAVRDGTGVAVIHAANNAFPGWVEYEKLCGLCWRDGTGHGRFHPFDVVIRDHEHPITRALPDLLDHPDELYHRLVPMHRTPLRLLATAFSARDTGGTGQDEPMVVTLQYGEGRVFHTPLGHVWPDQPQTRASHEDPRFQDLVRRGVEWAATGEVREAPVTTNQLTEAQREQGWQLLFDGESTEGWRALPGEGFPAAGWAVEDGCLRTLGGDDTDLATAMQFEDFDLRFEWRVSDAADSGVMYRVSDADAVPWRTGPEYQILDDRRYHDGRSTDSSAAALTALYVAEQANPFPPGQFNRGRILVQGSRVEHWLNGRRVVSCTLGDEDWRERIAASKFASMPAFAASRRGRIVLQSQGDVVWFRNLMIRVLEPEDADPDGAAAESSTGGEGGEKDVPAAPEAQRPNVLWIHVEDMSPLLGCYGVDVDTPALDRLAAEGVLFERAFTPTPVCSTCRSSLMVGASATTFGLHQHRSSRTPETRIELPEGVRALPELMREAGYHTFNHGAGKLDFNFAHDRAAMFDNGGGPRGFWRPGQPCAWRDRPAGKPFFGMIQLQGGKEQRRPELRTDPAEVHLPAYYPDHPVLREFFAGQYDAARVTDADVAALLAELAADGLERDTVVLFHSDHGMRCMRDKQFCYDGGLRVPFLARWPARPDLLPPGTRRSEITAILDLTATTLWLAGVPVPEWMESRPLLGSGSRPRDHVIAARDRCDFTIDRIRSVRTDRFRYVRNFLTDRPYAQPTYKDGQGGVFAHVEVLRELAAAGALNEQQAWFLGAERPAEELYDHSTDPDETRNLAQGPAFAEVLTRHRQLLEDWIRDTGDRGQQPEDEAQLLAVLRQWGSRCINPEYDTLKARHPELWKEGAGSGKR